MKAIYLFLSLALLPFKVLSQDNRTDSISAINNFVTDSPVTLPRELKLNTEVRYYDFGAYSPTEIRQSKALNLNMPKFTSDILLSRATASSWNGGRIYAIGGIQTMPGLMGIESGSVNLEQYFGNFSFNVYGGAEKYGYFNGLKTSYGFGAEATYRFNDKVSVTVFGSYFSPVMLMNPAMAGYVRVPNFGGYLDFSISNRFGVQVGAQTYRSMTSNRWETQPIVRPYYKLSEKAAIGVDVGGILYNVLKSNVGSSWGTHNPTMGPPVPKLSEMMGY